MISRDALIIEKEGDSLKAQQWGEIHQKAWPLLNAELH